MSYFPDEEQEAERRVIRLLRAKSPAWRLAKAFSLSATTRELAESSIRMRRPEATAREVRLSRAERCYGRDLLRALGVQE